MELDEHEAVAARDFSYYLRLWESMAAKSGPVREMIEPEAPERRSSSQRSRGVMPSGRFLWLGVSSAWRSQ